MHTWYHIRLTRIPSLEKYMSRYDFWIVAPRHKAARLVNGSIEGINIKRNQSRHYKEVGSGCSSRRGNA